MKIIFLKIPKLVNMPSENLVLQLQPHGILPYNYLQDFISIDKVNWAKTN